MMKKINLTILLTIVLVLGMTVVASAHFQMILPSDDMLTRGDSKEIDLDLLFTHPMSAAEVMDMEQPNKFGVIYKGKKKDLLGRLEEQKIMKGKSYNTTYQIRGFGDYIFYLEPGPYWEPLENKYITHCTKVVVNSMAVSTNWDEEIGMKAEIVPLVRPYGLWTGNTFRGIIKKNGNPVPNAEIEVEYFNQAKFPELKGEVDEAVELPNDNFVTQVIKADENGVFSYTMPKAGWWGFAALMEGEKINDKDHELGALMWVKTYDMK
jgi:cobalt/nickel transport protein